MTEEEQKIIDLEHATDISIKLVNEFCDNFYNTAIQMGVSGKVQPMVWEATIRMLLKSFYIMCSEVGVKEERIKEMCHSLVDSMQDCLDGVDCKSVQIHHVDFK